MRIAVQFMLSCPWWVAVLMRVQGANVYLASAELAAVAAILGRLPTTEVRGARIKTEVAPRVAEQMLSLGWQEYLNYYVELGKQKARRVLTSEVDSFVEAASE
eukprot:586025-Amphidinium_carterae.1